MSNYYNPVKIINTNFWESELRLNIEDLNITLPSVIATPGNRKRLNLDSIFPNTSIFSDFGSNPNFDDCYKAIQFFRKNQYDGVVAIGGGSAMDLAKVVIAYLSLGKTNIHELINYDNDYNRDIPSIFIPTTHGTASEVTMWGTIWNLTENKKYSISHPSLYPNIAILDGNLTLSLPLDISITTVMDALSHSLEAIWNKNANKISTDYAIKAICSILDNVSKLKETPNNLTVRKILLEASATSGLAFSNTKTAAAHSMSYPLTLHYGIPHGIASSISLLPLLKINQELIKGPLNRICNNLDLTIDQLQNIIAAIPKNILPFNLKSWEVPKNQLPQLAKESFTKGRMDNNIVDLNINDVLMILNNIYQ